MLYDERPGARRLDASKALTPRAPPHNFQAGDLT